MHVSTQATSGAWDGHASGALGVYGWVTLRVPTSTTELAPAHRVTAPNGVSSTPVLRQVYMLHQLGCGPDVPEGSKRHHTPGHSVSPGEMVSLLALRCGSTPDCTDTQEYYYYYYY